MFIFGNSTHCFALWIEQSMQISSSCSFRRTFHPFTCTVKGSKMILDWLYMFFRNLSSIHNFVSIRIRIPKLNLKNFFKNKMNFTCLITTILSHHYQRLTYKILRTLVKTTLHYNFNTLTIVICTVICIGFEISNSSFTGVKF